MKSIISTIILLLMNFCDPTYTERINGEKTYNVYTCGRITIYCKGATGLTFSLRVTPSNDTLFFNPARAYEAITQASIGVDFSKFRFSIDNVEAKDDTILAIYPTKTLGINMSVGLGERDRIRIPPGDYIMCNGLPIISDTLRIGDPSAFPSGSNPKP